MRGIVLRGARQGLHHSVVAEQIRQRFAMPKKRAALIATDQIGKLNGELNSLRQQNIGVRRYRWSSSQDERVRPRHRALNDTIQTWTAPPIVDERTGERGHPGQPIRCRCQPIPIIDDVLVDAGLMDPADVDLGQSKAARAAQRGPFVPPRPRVQHDPPAPKPVKLPKVPAALPKPAPANAVVTPPSAPAARDPAGVTAARPAVQKALEQQRLAAEAIAENPKNNVAWRIQNRGVANKVVQSIAGKEAAVTAQTWTNDWAAPKTKDPKAMSAYFARMSEQALSQLNTPGSWSHAQHTATQATIEESVLARLRAEGKVDADGFITLYRGVREEQSLGFIGQPGGELVVNELSSWSESSDVAKSFGNTVLESRIHYSRAFTSHSAQGGRLWSDEQEWIIITRDGKQAVKVHGYGR